MTKFISALIIVGLSSIASAEQRVTISEVLHHPEKYNSHEPLITGYISIEFENITIAASDKFKYGECVWIEFDKGPKKRGSVLVL